MISDKKRCPWVNLKNPQYIEYHDNEWGRPVHDDIKHFEFLTLEAAQAGLSWETVLKKRENYRKLFSGFDPNEVSRFTQAKVEKLLTNPGIIRNRLKVESTICNAKRFLEVQKEFGSFDKYIWGFVNHKTIHRKPRTLKEYKSTSKESDALSKDMKMRGFKFVGSTVLYAHLQAAGLINEHSAQCFLRHK